MKQAGQIALLPFPFMDLSESKLRPVLLLRPASRRFDDWLVCMISSQVRQAEPDLDEILAPDDGDFAGTGLKAISVLRLARLAVVDGAMFVGHIGRIDAGRLDRLLHRLAAWLTEEPPP